MGTEDRRAFFARELENLRSRRPVDDFDNMEFFPSIVPTLQRFAWTESLGITGILEMSVTKHMGLIAPGLVQLISIETSRRRIFTCGCLVHGSAIVRGRAAPLTLQQYLQNNPAVEPLMVLLPVLDFYMKPLSQA